MLKPVKCKPSKLPQNLECTLDVCGKRTDQVTQNSKLP